MTANREAMTLEEAWLKHSVGYDEPHTHDHYLGFSAGWRLAMQNLSRAAEPVYQYSFYDGRAAIIWRDCSKELFDSTPRDARRILYTHPPEPAVKSADEPRAVLLDQTLRERAHALRREACSAWSAVAVPCDHIDEAKCQYAAAQEKYLESVIDELADLTCAPEDAKRLDWLDAHPRLSTIVVNGVPTECYFYGVAGAPGLKLREVIDAAMAQESGE